MTAEKDKREKKYSDIVSKELVNLFLESNVRLGILGADINVIHFMPVWYHHIVVAEYAKNIAMCLQMGASLTRRIYIAALLHDVSKLFWSDKLHVYPYRFLDNEDRQRIRNHPKESVNILMESVPAKRKTLLVTGDPSVVDLIELHHEKPDGSGYYRAKDIPKSVAVLAVADVFDACTENRPYRLRNMPPDEAFKMAVDSYKSLFAEDEILMIKRTLIWTLQQRNHYTTFFFDVENVT